MKQINHIILTVLMLLACGPMWAQRASVTTTEYYPAAGAVGDTTVSFVIFMPGPEIYELEGHAALRLQLPQGDYGISFGTFDFNQPNFVYRFVKGETDYWAVVVPWGPFMDTYVKQGRAVYNLQLDLTAEQKAKLLALVENNLLPENRTYRYNYVKDNCATRPLGLLEQAVPGLKLAPVKTAERMETYRDVMRYYHRNYPWYQFGIDLALGTGIDYKLNNREYAFAPALLLSQLQGAKVNGKPIVSKVEQLNPGAADATAGPTNLLLTPFMVGMYIIGLAIYFSRRPNRSDKAAKVFDTVYFTALGLVGCVLTFLVFVSVHEATSPNWLLLAFNPLCFIFAIGIWIKSLKKVVNSYIIVNFALVILMFVMYGGNNAQLDSPIIALLFADLLRCGVRLYQNVKEAKNLK